MSDQSRKDGNRATLARQTEEHRTWWVTSLRSGLTPVTDGNKDVMS